MGSTITCGACVHVYTWGVGRTIPCMVHFHTCVLECVHVCVVRLFVYACVCVVHVVHLLERVHVCRACEHMCVCVCTVRASAGGGWAPALTLEGIRAASRKARQAVST